MYLTGEKFFSEFNEKENENSKEVNKIFNLPFRAEKVVFDVGYWRKANQIHNWFVQNIQEGNDNCRDYWVSDETLELLLKICKEVLKDKSKAKKLLPTTSGFFFGGTEYDEDYFDEVKRTIEILEKALKYKDELDFTYHSSW